MNDDLNQRARAVFLELSTLDVSEDSSELDRLVGDDLELRAAVESLLQAQQSADNAGLMTGATASQYAAPIQESSGSVIGRYKVLQLIGEGGFGSVFLAEQSQPVRRRVALKVIKLGMDTKQVIARFEAERQALALMDHPHIARVFDAGATESGRPYFAMEYVVGDAITKFADAYRLDIPARLRLLSQVCSAVQHAHTKGVIHRDLKPGNVLVSMVDGRPFAKVIDFGIAKATASALTDKTVFTEHRQLIGTPEYMSPEQADGSPDIDTRTDVYALGVLMYELLTGATPFDAARLRSAAWGEMQRIIREEEPPKPSLRLSRDVQTLAKTAAARNVEPPKLSTSIRGELDWIVMKALDKDRSRRYASPADLAEEIEKHLAGDAVEAAPPSVRYRLRKFVRRRKGQAVLLLVLIAGLVGTSGALWVAQYNASAALNNASIAMAARDELTIANASLLTETQASLRSAYVARIFAAFADPYSARHYLDLCAETLRNWEWRYLLARSDVSRTVLRVPGTDSGHWHQAMFAANGELVVALAETGRIYAYQASTGELVSVSDDNAEIVHMHTSPLGNVLAVAERVADPATGNTRLRWAALDSRTLRLRFSLPSQGTVAPTGNAIYVPGRVLHATDGSTLATIDTESRYRHHRTEFSRDGKALVTWGPYTDGDRNYRIDLWDATTGQLLHSVDQLPNVIDLLVAGDKLVTTHHGEYRTWDASTLESLAGAEASAWTWAAASSDGRYLYARSARSDARIHDLATGEVVQRLVDDEFGVNTGEFAPDGETVITGVGPYVCIWDVQSGARVARLAGHSDAWINAEASPDGSLILSRAWDGSVRIWDAEDFPTRSFDASDYPFYRPGSVRSRDSLFNGQYLLAPSRTGDATVELVNVTTGLASTSWVVPAPDQWDGLSDFDDAFFSPDGQRVITRRGSSVRAWSASSGKPLGEAVVPVHLDNPDIRDRPVSVRHGHAPVRHPVSLACDDAGSRILACLGNGLAAVYSIDDGSKLFEAEGEGYPCGTITTDGMTAAIAWSDGLIRIYEAASGRELQGLQGHTDSVTAAVFDPSGRFLATRSEDRTIRLWNVQTGQNRVVAEVDQPDFDRWLKYEIGNFDPDGRFLTVILDNQCLVIDTDSGEAVSELRGHTWSIYHALLSPDGSRVFTSSEDNSIRVWDTTTGQEMLVLRPEVFHEDGFDTLQLSPDGTRLVARYSYDPTVHVFDTVPFRERLAASRSDIP